MDSFVSFKLRFDLKIFFDVVTLNILSLSLISYIHNLNILWKSITIYRSTNVILVALFNGQTK